MVNFCLSSFTDRSLRDGVERPTFEAAIYHVIMQRFGWSRTIADVVLHTYTDWTAVDDHERNRNSYVQVNINFRVAIISKLFFDHIFHLASYTFLDSIVIII